MCSWGFVTGIAVIERTRGEGAGEGKAEGEGVRDVRGACNEVAWVEVIVRFTSVGGEGVRDEETGESWKEGDGICTEGGVSGFGGEAGGAWSEIPGASGTFGLGDPFAIKVEKRGEERTGERGPTECTRGELRCGEAISSRSRPPIFEFVRFSFKSSCAFAALS